jgi:hypothetical protein
VIYVAAAQLAPFAVANICAPLAAASDHDINIRTPGQKLLSNVKHV